MLNNYQSQKRNTILGKPKKKQALKDYDDINDDDDSKEQQETEEEEEEEEKTKESKSKNKKKNKKGKHKRRFETKKLKAKDFTFMSVIGRGTFGKILLVKKKSNNNIYAMKILKKTQIIENEQAKNVNAEREVLKSIKHPFLMNLRYAFQTETKLYLVLDYYRGGELMFHLKQKRRFDEEETKFITCQIMLALGCLHKHGFIYRDLKVFYKLYYSPK